MTPQARQIIREVAALYGIDPLEIVGASRRQKAFRARVEVAHLLTRRGYSSTRIGIAIGKDHTTVVFYLGRGRKGPSPEKHGPPRKQTVHARDRADAAAWFKFRGTVAS